MRDDTSPMSVYDDPTVFRTFSLDDFPESELESELGSLGEPAHSLTHPEPEDDESKPYVLMSEVTEKPITYWWTYDGVGLLAKGEVAGLGGPDGQGKSLLTYLWAAHATDQGETALFVSPEETPEHTWKPRLNVVGADPELVAYFDANAHEINLSKDTPAKAFGALIRAMDALRPALVVIDPVTDFLGDLNQMDEQDSRKALRHLAWLAREYNTAVVFVKHWRKGSGATREMMAGSRAWTARPRFVFGLVQNEVTPGAGVFGVVKSNLVTGKPAWTFDLVGHRSTTLGQSVPLLRLGSKSELSVDEVLAANHEPKAREPEVTISAPDLVALKTDLLRCIGDTPGVEVSVALHYLKSNLCADRWATLSELALRKAVPPGRYGAGGSGWGISRKAVSE